MTVILEGIVQRGVELMVFEAASKHHSESRVPTEGVGDLSYNKITKRLLQLQVQFSAWAASTTPAIAGSL